MVIFEEDTVKAEDYKTHLLHAYYGRCCFKVSNYFFFFFFLLNRILESQEPIEYIALLKVINATR